MSEERELIPEEHRAIMEELGWDEDEYFQKMRVLNRDGVTLEELAEWKRQYGDVYRDVFLGRPFYYRSITRKEHTQQVMNLTADYHKREEIIASLCTLHPKDYDFSEGPGGLATRLMELILDHSGFITDGPTMTF